MILDRYRTLKQKNIPKELDDYLNYVAKTGDPVYSWSTIQYLFREKLTSVIREFHDTTPSIDGGYLPKMKKQGGNALALNAKLLLDFVCASLALLQF